MKMSTVSYWERRGEHPQTATGRTECRVPKDQAVVASDLSLVDCQHNTVAVVVLFASFEDAQSSVLKGTVSTTISGRRPS